ncbi:MAG: hypothetical protein ABIA47_04050 [bacterium]
MIFSLLMMVSVAAAQDYDNDTVNEHCVYGDNLVARKRSVLGGVVIYSLEGDVDYGPCVAQDDDKGRYRTTELQNEDNSAVDHAPPEDSMYYDQRVDSDYDPNCDCEECRLKRRQGSVRQSNPQQGSYERSVGAMEAYRRQSAWNDGMEASVRASAVDAASSQSELQRERALRQKAEAELAALQAKHAELTKTCHDFMKATVDADKEKK